MSLNLATVAWQSQQSRSEVHWCDNLSAKMSLSTFSTWTDGKYVSKIHLVNSAVLSIVRFFNIFRKCYNFSISSTLVQLLTHTNKTRLAFQAMQLNAMKCSIVVFHSSSWCLATSPEKVKRPLNKLCYEKPTQTRAVRPQADHGPLKKIGGWISG